MRSFNENNEYSNIRKISKSRTAINRYKQSRKRKSNNILLIVGVVLAVVLTITIAIFGAIRYLQYRNEKKELEGYSYAEMKQDIYIDFSVIGMNRPLSIKGKTLQDVYDEVFGTYKLNAVILNSNPELDIFDMPVYGEVKKDEDYDKYIKSQNSDSLGSGQEIEVVNPLADITIKAEKERYVLPDFLEGQLKLFIDDIYDKYLYLSSNDFNKKNVDIESPDFKADFKFEASMNDENLDSALSQLARLWNTKAIKGQIEGFDNNTNEFIFGDDHKGYEIDIDTLRKRIIDEVNSGNLNFEIPTVLNFVDASGAAVKSRYKYVSMYETWTTDNEKRNGNIALACKGLNGYIVKPGQEFSFNKLLGERTEERGYDFAPAYLEGQVIEELGGGICQVSTTLYNAVFAAGLTTTFRKSHTFEPSYITPGLDATVSFYGPDYRFINNSNYSIGIKATYAKQKVKVEIFAVPMLLDGVTQNLVSKKIQDIDPPSLSIINEGRASKGSKGSEWQVFKVVKQGEKEIERTFDHATTYHGHTPTAFEEYTFVDEDGVLQTSRFVETRRNDPSTVRNTNITTARRESSIQVISPTESSSDAVVEAAPGGGSTTGQPQ